MALSKSEKLKYCRGCTSDFYNGNNKHGIKECWCLKTAKLVKRYKIYWWTPMDKASNFTEVKVLSCYSDLRNGQGNAYLINIPGHLKLEWDKLQKKNRRKAKHSINKLLG